MFLLVENSMNRDYCFCNGNCFLHWNGSILYSVLLGLFETNSHKVVNCQMAHEDNDRLKNIFYLLIGY